MQTNVKKRTIVEAIPFHSIKAETEIGFDIYHKTADGFVKVLQSGETYPNSLKERLSLGEGGELFVKSTQKSDYFAYLEHYLKEIIRDQDIPLKAKSQAIYNSASKVLEDLFEKPESPENIIRVKGVVENVIDTVLNDERSVRSLMEVGSFDYYTYTHSVDVGVYAVGFGQHLGFSTGELEKVGYSAMMHDVGKSRIDDQIINKQGRLSQEEFETMKKHPLFGYEIMMVHNELDKDILGGIRYHHEKKNGNGYPEKLYGKEIPLFAQMIAISDIFSALSTKRSYKDAFSSYETLKMMKGQMSEDLDTALLTEFIRFMGKTVSS